ncbi:hypothetical protein G7Z17_g57 [Cylindrodendrum hubeiense]|uniref:Fungal STAND N-terminal Goodbye domain-containing protein n=1 Tax=Cylindrodendrum hubeiense TaxID=595255 RepID=A0A9P5HNC7_9HYPO|nr:hypothetical protein G7Z17_g57 [Cylindrodendrum hubeiense]
MSTGPASRVPDSAQQKELDLIWEQVQAKVVELAGGDPRKVQRLGISNVLEQLDSYNDNKNPQSYSRLKKAVDNTLQCIETIGGIVTQGVSTVLAPANMCYNALTFVIQAWKGYEGMFENMAELLEKCMEFLDRLSYYDQKMDANLTKLACQNLRLFVEICHRTVRLRKKHTRFLAFTKQLFLNDDGVQDLLTLMERLNGKEALLVAAQTFEIVNDSAGDLKIIVEEQNEQRKKQDSKQRRRTIADALVFRTEEINSTGEPIATWRRSLDSNVANIVGDTGDWLIEDPVFQDWAQADVPSKPILVLQGNSYSGKTSTMVNALRFLRQQSKNVPTSRIVTSYFFPDEDAKQVEVSNAEPILEMVSKALLWQIGVSFEALTKSFAHKAQTSRGFMGWLDVWDQLYITNPERMNPDTTFFLFIDSSDANNGRVEALVPLFQKLASTTLGGKTRILFTAGPQAAAECIRHVNGAQFEVINITDRNRTDIDKYINYRMNRMPVLRDPSRPGIAQWRKRIIIKLAEKCAGDYSKLNSSLNAIAQMHLVQDIEEVLAQADETRSQQIQAEISHLNNTRTPKEIEEMNEIIIWVNSGRRWLQADILEALLAIKHQVVSTDAKPFLARQASGSLLAASSSSGGTLSVSLLPFSQKLLEIYCLFTITETNDIKWRDPETESSIPCRADLQNDDSKMLQSIISTPIGSQMVQEGEIDIVRHFLHNVCPPRLYERLGFESFFDTKLRAQKKEYICFDENNAHIRIAIAYLTILTNETSQHTRRVLQLARRDLLYHLKKVDLSAADPAFKCQVGPLLVFLLTEQSGIWSLFLPASTSGLHDWITNENTDLRVVRAEWLYSLEGTREVVRWLNDSSVTKSIQGHEAEAFVKGINGLDQNLHRFMLSHAATHLARRLFHHHTPQLRELSCVCLFLRGYLMRCDATISSGMANEAAFYIELEKEAAKEIEGVKNFDLKTFKDIENWAVAALDKANNTPSQDSHWEYQASVILQRICPSVPASEATVRLHKAIELDSHNFDARLVVAADATLGNKEAIQALSALKADIENSSSGEYSQLLASTSLGLGNRLWDVGEDYELAARAHIESLSYDFLSWEYMSILRRYNESHSHENMINFFRKLNARSSIWESDPYQLYSNTCDFFDEPHIIAEAADATEGWDVVITYFNLLVEGLKSPEFSDSVADCYKLLGDCLGASSDAAKREQRTTRYEAALDGAKLHAGSNGAVSKFSLFMIIHRLTAAYLEQAFASEPGSERLQSCLTKIAGLLSIADTSGDILQATPPTCSLIVFHRKTGQFADIVRKWTPKIMLEILDLLSDDDEDNDVQAFLYLLQLLIALKDIENIRIVMAMFKWEVHTKRVGMLNAVARARTSNTKHLMHKSSSESLGESNAVSAEPSWSSMCDGCTVPMDIADADYYLCTDCVSISGFDKNCYGLFQSGNLDRQVDCSTEHEFIHVAAWKPDQESLDGQVPILEKVEGDSEAKQIGWMPLEEWKAKLKSLDAGKALANAIDVVLKQPGAQRVYTGVEIENPSNVWLFLDWESVDHHLNYRKTDAHGVVIESLNPHFDFTKSINKHVAVNPFPTEDVLDKTRSPVTEVLLAYFPSDYSEDSRAVAKRRLEQFTGRALKSSPDWRGISYGWSVENDVPVKGDESNSGALLVAFIGWPSVEAHKKFRETEDFKENISLLREIPGLTKLTTFHVSCISRAAEGAPNAYDEHHDEHGHDHGCGSGGCC